MGSWVSASFGYGIVVPSEDDDYEFDTSPGTFLADYVDEDEDGDNTINWSNVAEDLANKLHLTYDAGYVHDYGYQNVFFVGKPLNSYETVKGFEAGEYNKATNIKEVDYQALKVAAVTLGIPFDPKWILVASYG